MNNEKPHEIYNDEHCPLCGFTGGYHIVDGWDCCRQQLTVAQETSDGYAAELILVRQDLAEAREANRGLREMLENARIALKDAIESGYAPSGEDTRVLESIEALAATVDAEGLRLEREVVAATVARRKAKDEEAQAQFDALRVEDEAVDALLAAKKGNANA